MLGVVVRAPSGQAARLQGREAARPAGSCSSGFLAAGLVAIPGGTGAGAVLLRQEEAEAGRAFRTQALPRL